MHAIPLTRSPDLDLEKPSRYWFADNAWATHVVNGINLLFPAGERFFVRSVNHYLPQITDPTLRAQIKGFFGQEGSHAREHERAFRALEAQGYDIKRFLRFYTRVAYGFVERVSSPGLSLAVTAACEHYTAMLAEQALGGPRLLDRAEPEMRALLMWHASEEIEHRAVAFDVLQSVAPSYRLRLEGLALASLLLGGFWFLGATSLIVQEKNRGRVLRDWRIARKLRGSSGILRRSLRDYLRRDFHPLQRDLEKLAADYIASAGLPPMQAAPRHAASAH